MSFLNLWPLENQWWLLRLEAVRKWLLAVIQGSLVPPADSNALADAIIKLLQVSNKAEEMGKEGRKTVMAKFNSVNLMANNLTSQVRNIADVSTAIANGDLTKKITVEAKGEILGPQEHD